MNAAWAMAETTEAAAVPAQGSGSEWLCCQAGGQTLGVPVSAVREVVRCADLSPMPLTPPVVRGVMNLRGNPLLVLDLAALLGLAERPPKRHSAVVVVHAGQARSGTAVGLWVDRVHEILNVDAAQVGASPLFGAAIDRRFIKLVMNWRRQTLLGLAIEAVLTLDERAEQIAAHASARCEQHQVATSRAVRVPASV